MALRIRKDGRVLCAAMHGEEPGDTYLDDGLHYLLSVKYKVLVTQPHEQHSKNGQWWWKGNAPADVDGFYLGSTAEWMFVDVKRCQRCGFDHEQAVFWRLSNPANEFEWYSYCPAKGQPIFLAAVGVV